MAQKVKMFKIKLTSSFERDNFKLNINFKRCNKMEKQILELVKYLNQKLNQDGRALENNRYIPRESDLESLKSITSFDELKLVIKEARTRGYLRMVELGYSYTLTRKGQCFALFGEK